MKIMKNTVAIAGLRFQKYDSNEIHVHDDARKLKFTAESKTFKQDLKDALDQKMSGVALIEGTSDEKLCVIKDGFAIKAVIIGKDDMKSDIKSFLVSL